MMVGVLVRFRYDDEFDARAVRVIAEGAQSHFEVEIAALVDNAH